MWRIDECVLTVVFVCLQDGILPIPPAYIFMIDVSYQSVKSGLVYLLCARMRSVLDDLPRYFVQLLIHIFFTTCSK